MSRQPFEIPNILESYRNDVESGTITIEQAATESTEAAVEMTEE